MKQSLVIRLFLTSLDRVVGSFSSILAIELRVNFKLPSLSRLVAMILANELRSSNVRAF